MTNEEIAMQLVGLYSTAFVHSIASNEHKRSVANAILRLGYVWEDDLKLEEPK